MKLLVFGQTGQVARELAQILPNAAFDEVVFLSRAEADLQDPAACGAAIYHHRPHAVINAAAWTAVDRAESEEEAASIVNGASAGAMAQACADLGAAFVHISTDYVFDGLGDQPFSPDHPTAPLGAYGRGKLLGEKAVQAAGGAYVILRTSWVFSAHGHNFLKTMLRLGAERAELTVVSDQIGGPTPAAEIAKACVSIAAQLIADPGKSGLYHFSGAPDVSWADFARTILQKADRPDRPMAQIRDIPTSAWPTPAPRPLNSRMDCQALTRFNLARPDWAKAVDLILQDFQVPS